MNKGQFRWLLIIYVDVIVMALITEQYRHLLIHDVVIKMDPAYLSSGGLIYLLISIGAGFVGIIGMFCFWRPGRYIFLLSVVMNLFLYPLFLSWRAETGWHFFFSGIELTLEGAILTLALFGPAKHLFAGKKSR